MKKHQQIKNKINNIFSKIKIKYVFIFLSLIILDQITKYTFSKITADFGILALRPITNTGISFGLFQGNNNVLIIITSIFIILLFLFRKEFVNKIFLTMILAGAVGNLIDRIIRGHVLDFIDFKVFPVFNIADSLIFLGVAGIIYLEIKQVIKQNKTKTN